MSKMGGVFVRRVAMGIGVVVVLVFLCEMNDAWSSTAEKPFTLEERVLKISQGAVIKSVGVSLPVGRLLLVRLNTDLCAVRFTKFHR